MYKKLSMEELANIDDHFLLTKLVQKGIDHNISGKSEDYYESLDYFFEAKRRMDKSHEISVS